MIRPNGMKSQLYFLNLAPIGAFVLLSALSFQAIQSLASHIERQTEINFPMVRLVGEMDSATNGIFRWLNVSIIDRKIELRRAHLARAKNEIQRFEAAQKRLAGISKNPRDEELFKIIATVWPEAYRQAQRAIDVLELGGSKSTEKATTIVHAILRMQMEKITISLNKLRDQIEEAVAKESSQELAEAGRSKFVSLFVSAIGSLLLLMAGAWFIRKISGKLSQISQELAVSSDQVASAVKEVADSSTRLSDTAGKQADSLGETAALIEEISSMIGKGAQSAKEVSDLSTLSLGSAEEGKKVVTQMIANIGEINSSNSDILSSVHDSSRQMSDIVKVISEIGTKTQVINEIVFQTKLLSFNASVEAARAGEHGKGFAVVAEEVGNLAQMSGNAAREISSMLSESIKKVETIVSQTKNQVERLVVAGKSRVESGTKIAEHCGKVLEEIVQSVSSVSGAARGIASATAEQSQGIQEITQSVSQLERATQQYASTSQQSASASVELMAQAEALRNLGGALTYLVLGAKVQKAPPTRPVITPNKVPAQQTVEVRAAKVIPLTRTAKSPAPTAGFENVPSENDPRFKEI